MLRPKRILVHGPRKTKIQWLVEDDGRPLFTRLDDHFEYVQTWNTKAEVVQVMKAIQPYREGAVWDSIKRQMNSKLLKQEKTP